MTATVFPPPPTVLLPVEGADARFPVRRVYCVGRNYAEHAREMGGDPAREAPFFFQKNPEDLVADGRFPHPGGEVHHEVELAVLIGRCGEGIAEDAALDHVWGYAAALDMTRRDVQTAAKKAGRPWTAAKAFPFSAPIGLVAPAASVGHPARGRIALTVNGALRQEGDLADMIQGVPAIVAALSRLAPLAPGDVVLTGTPAGVGPVAAGDLLVATVEGLAPLRVAVV